MTGIAYPKSGRGPELHGPKYSNYGTGVKLKSSNGHDTPAIVIGECNEHDTLCIFAVMVS